MRLFLPLLFLLAAAGHVMAAEATFMGQKIMSRPGHYVVEKDVNIRARPKTNSKRLGKLKKGEVIEVVGRAPKSVWLAVVESGEPVGFVFGNVLSPIIDGELSTDVIGETNIREGRRCGYRVHFIGKTGGEAQMVRTSDYDSTIVCEQDGKRTRFSAQMFITEVPFNGSKKQRIFQINVDLLDDLHSLDDVFSTITLFDLDKGQVRFDRVTAGKYGLEDAAIRVLPAEDVDRALAAALEISLKNWSPLMWEEIANNTH